MKRTIFALLLMLPISGSIYALPRLSPQESDRVESRMNLTSGYLAEDPWVLSLQGSFANNSTSAGALALFSLTPRIGGDIDCYSGHNQPLNPKCEESGGLASAVPEPFSALLFGAGLTVMALRRRRRLK